MEDFYLEVREIHIWAIRGSGILFLLRSIAYNLFDAKWPMGPVRYLSYLIDTTLLTAALMLTTIIQQYPFVDAWLTVKVLLIAVYIVLGWLALRGSTKLRRGVCTAAAAAVFGFIISVARAHHPLGLLAS